MMDPIHQFNIEKIFTIGHIGGQEINFTNSSAYMLVTVVLTALLMLATGRQLVPGRLQSVAEISYEFVANTIRSTAGTEGMKFFPFVFTIFMLVTVSNMVGIIPYTFTISSHIIVTAALAFLVFFTVLIYGFYKNGLRFFKLFVPSGIPIAILPLVVVIEIISFLSRPISHSVRLFANMLAGHITLKVFASFITMLGAMGFVGALGAVLPLALTVFFTVLIYGLLRHGLHFFNLFVPKGVPIYILPLIVAIELLSFVSRPISHSVRLFANMLAGHITLQVFAGFIILLGTGLGVVGWIGGMLPFLLVVILFALETLVAFLQAYVFAILTCIYLNDAIHPGH